MANETSRTGVPLMRPFVFDFPEDTEALDQVHSYMFGRALHVAPVTQSGVASWPVYLPRSEGGWFDLWTGEAREGGREHSVPVTPGKLPLHVRAGSILPLGPVMQSTVEVTNDQIDLYVIPGRDAAFDLYEDHGIDNGYETGEFATTTIKWNDARGELQIGQRRGSFPGMQHKKRFVVRKVGLGVTPMITKPGYVIEYGGNAVAVALGRGPTNRR
jgi:alpha-D-xyloside xylohydrolase